MMDIFRRLTGTRPGQKRRFEEDQEVDIISYTHVPRYEDLFLKHIKLGANGREGVFGDAPRQKGAREIKQHLSTFMLRLHLSNLVLLIEELSFAPTPNSGQIKGTFSS